jgi:hypothetical protein
MTDTTLARRSTVRELVAAFQVAEQTVRRCFSQLAEAEREVNLAFTASNRSEISIDANEHWGSRWDDADATIEKMQRQAWRVIVDRLELRRAMSIARYDELVRTLDHEKLPPITEENVSAFVDRFAQDLPAMISEAVREVFEWLRPRNSKLKTNSEYEVPAKVILPSMVEMTFGRWHVNHYRQQNLVALENVFNSLAGNGQVAKAYQSQLQTAIEASSGEGETELFRFKACANRNLHLWFKRGDLLARFNRIAGGKRLRPAA